MTADSNGNARRRWIDVAVISGTLMIVSWLITEVTVPKVLTSAVMQMRLELDQRLATVDERFKLVSSQLDKLATAEGLSHVKSRLDGIEERLREMERKANGPK